MATHLSFLGAAETVTGSRFLLRSTTGSMLVDCGLFQGYKKLRLRNWNDPTFEASKLRAVILTHAHIDHSGYLPRLCKLGFGGPIYATPGTRDLLRIILPDAGHLQEEEARYANLHGYSRHRPALPLYTRAEAEHCLKQIETRNFHEPFAVAPNLSASFSRTGHILGSASVRLELPGTTITFSGDVGRPHDPILRPAEPLAPTDYLVTESTYGDRRHPEESAFDALAQVIDETAAQGGVILVPAFAVGRAQYLLHCIAELKRAARIPDLPVFLDSPLAIEATEIFYGHASDSKLSSEQVQRMSSVAQYARTPEESKAIDARTGPMLIVSASGMATGGRILHHLRRFLPERQHTVLLTGYQAQGTRGRSLADGADELKIHGQYIKVKARIRYLQTLSAHADYAELLAWFAASKLAPRRVFVTHGEPAAADALRRRLTDSFGWDSVVPEDGSEWKL